MMRIDVIARLGERDALDPVDRIDLRIARIAVGRDPLLHAAAAGIVAGESEDVGAVVAAEQIRQFGRAHLHVVDRVAEQAVAVIGALNCLAVSMPAAGVTCISPMAWAGETTF